MLKKQVLLFVVFRFSSLFSTSVELPTIVDFRNIPFFQDKYLYDEMHSWSWKVAKSALELGYIGFNDSPEIGAFINQLKNEYKIDAAVETGTFFGATTHFFSLHFDQVHTIEASENFYYKAKDHLKFCPNVHCHFGSSEKVFSKILPPLADKRVLFYLDAHTDFFIAQKGGYHYWPILEELEEISKTHKDNCIVVIDDFYVPNTDIHGCLDSHGNNELSHELIRHKLMKIFTGYTFHYLIPKTVSRAAKFVAIPKKWQNKLASSLHAGRVDVLPGLDFYSLPINLSFVKNAGFDIRISNQFFNGEDQGNYEEEIRFDSDLKKIVVFNNTVDPKYLATFPKDKLVLFLLEPLKLPFSYFDPCSRVYTWNDDLVDGVKFFKLYYPYLVHMLSHIPSFEEKKLCVMISGSDNAYPERPNELYTERMKMAEFFETKPEGEFDIYGRYWVKRFYRDFRGSIAGDIAGDEKIQVLKNYRFSICFENTKNIKGYITEKIFSCFAAGCVPIYWGADNIDQYIPKECFIDYRDFQSREQLYQFVKGMPKIIYQQYIDRIREFLKSEKANVFTPEYFGEILHEAITG